MPERRVSCSLDHGSRLAPYPWGPGVTSKQPSPKMIPKLPHAPGFILQPPPHPPAKGQDQGQELECHGPSDTPPPPRRMAPGRSQKGHPSSTKARVFLALRSFIQQ